MLGEIPELCMTVCNGGIEVCFTDQAADCPFVSAIFMPLSAVYGRVPTVKATCDAMPNLMGKASAFVCITLELLSIDSNIAFPMTWKRFPVTERLQIMSILLLF